MVGQVFFILGANLGQKFPKVASEGQFGGTDVSGQKRLNPAYLVRLRMIVFFSSYYNT